MLKILTLNNVKDAECSNKCKKINNETIGAKDKNNTNQYQSRFQKKKKKALKESIFPTPLKLEIND